MTHFKYPLLNSLIQKKHHMINTPEAVEN